LPPISAAQVSVAQVGAAQIGAAQVGAARAREFRRVGATPSIPGRDALFEPGDVFFVGHGRPRCAKASLAALRPVQRRIQEFCTNFRFQSLDSIVEFWCGKSDAK
jgi:hypothetical protein